jgi:transposase-like protein
LAANRTKISQIIIDETLIRTGREVVVWLWIAIEPKSKSILEMHVSLESGILVAEQFLKELFKNMENIHLHSWRAWYPQRCGF